VKLRLAPPETQGLGQDFLDDYVGRLLNPELLGRDGTQGNENDNQQQLLHRFDPTRRGRTRSPEPAQSFDASNL